MLNKICSILSSWKTYFNYWVGSQDFSLECSTSLGNWDVAAWWEPTLGPRLSPGLSVLCCEEPLVHVFGFCRMSRCTSILSSSQIAIPQAWGSTHQLTFVGWTGMEFWLSKVHLKRWGHTLACSWALGTSYPMRRAGSPLLRSENHTAGGKEMG